MTDPVDAFGAAADQLGDALDQAEVLFEKRFRVSASVQLQFLPGASLHYRRTGSVWGLSVGPVEYTELRKVPLITRQMAAHKLDELWQECESIEAAVSKDVVEARQVVLAFLERRGSK